MPLILPALNNGPEEVGLKAAAGDRDDSRSTVVVYENIEDTLSRLPVIPGATAADLQRYRVMVYVVVRHCWYMYGDDVDANVIVHDTNDPNLPALENGAWQPDQAWVDALTDVEQCQAALLVMATKVNMWQINHHTGQGEVTGFTAKAMRLVGGIGSGAQPTRSFIACVWTAGHLVSTKAAWRAFGVVGIRDPEDGDFDPSAWPVPTRDITIRMEAGPAGAAKATTSRAIVRFAAQSAFSVTLPASASYAALAQLPLVVLQARHHDASAYFTGSPKIELFEVSDDLLADLSCFIHAVAPKSTLAGAKVILNRSLVSGLDLYVRLVSLITSVRAVAADERNIERLKIMLGVGPGGDPMGAALAVFGLNARPVVSEASITAAIAAKKIARAAEGEVGAGAASAGSAVATATAMTEGTA